MSGLQTPRKRVEGLGSAKHGAGLWRRERFSALILIPLILWGLCSAAHLAGGGYDAALAWLQQPFNLVLLAAVLAVCLWHMEMGMRVIIEDYVHGTLGGLLVLLNSLFCWGLGLAAAAAVLSGVFGVGAGVH
ncbi:MAG: succinate dehydrogenase, hydrophobic membrane anchor protein [Caulobacteraceae bacterium]|nr:succinate dehydrogenase, hydrophobic membrane anchor protein [Caulobacteraceae bacterium]